MLLWCSSQCRDLCISFLQSGFSRFLIAANGIFKMTDIAAETDPVQTRKSECREPELRTSQTTSQVSDRDSASTRRSAPTNTMRVSGAISTLTFRRRSTTSSVRARSASIRSWSTLCRNRFLKRQDTRPWVSCPRKFSSQLKRYRVIKLNLGRVLQIPEFGKLNWIGWQFKYLKTKKINYCLTKRTKL